MGLFQSGSKWGVDYWYRNGTGKLCRKRVLIGNKTQASAYEARIKVGLAEEKILGVKKLSPVAFSTIAQNYLEYSKAHKKDFAYRADKRVAENWEKFFEGKHFNQITLQDIEQYKTWRLGTKVQNATVNRELALFKAVVNRAVQMGILMPNPLQKIKLLKEPAGRIRYLSPDEILKLIEVCRRCMRVPALYPIVQLALNTGMRIGEIRSLKWSHIDFNQKLILLDVTKNGRRREIPINGLTDQMLTHWPRHLFSPYVFVNPKTAKPFTKIDKCFRRAVKKAGITDFRFHDLRHTFASLLRQKGFDLGLIKDLLGHSSLAMVLRYAHLGENEGRKAVESMMDIYPREEINTAQLTLFG